MLEGLIFLRVICVSIRRNEFIEHVYLKAYKEEHQHRWKDSYRKDRDNMDPVILLGVAARDRKVSCGGDRIAGSLRA